MSSDAVTLLADEFDAVKHLSDDQLRKDLQTVVARERAATARLLVRLSEFDARKLYVPDGYPSMHAYCVGALKFSDDEAYTRIRVARAGYRAPALLLALSEGRIHMTAARLIASHLSESNAGELVAACAHRSRLEIERMLERRFGGSPGPELEIVSSALPATHQLVSEPVEFSREFADFGAHLAAGEPHAPAGGVQLTNADPAVSEAPMTCAIAERSALGVDSSDPPSTLVSTLEDEVILLKIAIKRSTLERFEYARLLVGHSGPLGGLGHVLDRAAVLVVAELEKQKFAATSRPRVPREARTIAAPRTEAVVAIEPSAELSAAPCAAPFAARSASPSAAPSSASPAAPSSAPPPQTSLARTNARRRYVSSHVKRSVWARDGARCTFVAASGYRCEARHGLEFDHVEPVARGGESTVEGLRLRCRAHNQYEAERAFGAEFMIAKREAARRAAEDRRRAAIGSAAGRGP